jgi:hypothetical protein
MSDILSEARVAEIDADLMGGSVRLCMGPVTLMEIPFGNLKVGQQARQLLASHKALVAELKGKDAKLAECRAAFAQIDKLRLYSGDLEATCRETDPNYWVHWLKREVDKIPQVSLSDAPAEHPLATENRKAGKLLSRVQKLCRDFLVNTALIEDIDAFLSAHPVKP